MSYDLNKHHRQSIRLKNYEYSQAGAYIETNPKNWEKDTEDA
jgi:hypothetical protein